MAPILAQAAESAVVPPQGKRVFYASHSLMWYVPEPLGALATAGGIKDHKLAGLQKIGASRTLQHWNLPDAQNEAKKALKTGEVDVLVMSPIQFPDEGVENFVKGSFCWRLPLCAVAIPSFKRTLYYSVR